MLGIAFCILSICARRWVFGVKTKRPGISRTPLWNLVQVLWTVLTKDWFADRDFWFSRYWIRGTDQKPKNYKTKSGIRGSSTFRSKVVFVFSGTWSFRVRQQCFDSTKMMMFLRCCDFIRSMAFLPRLMQRNSGLSCEDPVKPLLEQRFRYILFTRCLIPINKKPGSRFTA